MKPLEYIKDTKVELSHVSWPTRRQALAFTALVIGISLAFAVYLGLADFLFSRVVEWVIS